MTRYHRTMTRALAYAQEHGSLSELPGNHPLAESLRALDARGSLLPTHEAELRRLGWVPQRRDARWASGFAELARYRASYGDSDVPARYVTADGYRLGQWLWVQRRQARAGRLDAERMSLLSALGVALPGSALADRPAAQALGLRSLDTEGHPTNESVPRRRTSPQTVKQR